MEGRPKSVRHQYFAAGIVVAATVALGFVFNGVVSEGTALVMSNHLMTVVPWISVPLSFLAARRQQGRDRLGWILLGCWGVLSASGNMVWSYYELIAHTDPFPSLADAGYLGGNLCAAAAIVVFATGTKRVSRLRTVLDATLIAGSVLIVSWVIVLGPIYEAAGTDIVSDVIGLAYPVIDVAFVSLVVFVASRSRSADRVPLVIIGMGVLGWALADSAFAYMQTIESYSSGGFTDAGWIGGDALIVVAAAWAVRAAKRKEQMRPESAVARWRVHLPYWVTGVAFAIVVAWQLKMSADAEIGVLYGFMGLLVLVVFRQFLVVVEQQRQTIERMHSVDEMKNEILRAVSHELRTPLTFIKGAALMLNDDEDPLSPEHRRDLLERLERNCDRLEDFLTGLLDLERLTRGVLEPARRPADVRALLLRIAETVDTRAIWVRGPEVWANVDTAQVERIVENLFVNAVRHTPKGTRIRAASERVDGGVLITVTDNGPGVADAIKENIFLPFAQAEESIAAGRGTGIGLALVAKFAELHRGRAWVEDAPGGGARFCVWLSDPNGVPEPSAKQPVAA